MKKIIFALIFVMLFSLTACGFDTENETSAPMTTENILSDDALVSDNPQVTTWDVSQTSTNGVVTYTVRDMYGVSVLKKITASADKTYRISYDLDVTKGNVRVYVVNDGKIIADMPVGTDKSIDISGLDGRVDVRCSSATSAFKLTFTVEEVQPDTSAN